MVINGTEACWEALLFQDPYSLSLPPHPASMETQDECEHIGKIAEGHNRKTAVIKSAEEKFDRK